MPLQHPRQGLRKQGAIQLLTHLYEVVRWHGEAAKLANLEAARKQCAPATTTCEKAEEAALPTSVRPRHGIDPARSQHQALEADDRGPALKLEALDDQLLARNVRRTLRSTAGANLVKAFGKIGETLEVCAHRREGSIHPEARQEEVDGFLDHAQVDRDVSAKDVLRLQQPCDHELDARMKNVLLVECVDEVPKRDKGMEPQCANVDIQRQVPPLGLGKVAGRATSDQLLVLRIVLLDLPPPLRELLYVS
mmetsp:Transcript_52506/g.151303  ORF Transcript_52506/g.151303 Transcript_52506/m.151303 type:complete len:250 (+) Transcript_52506:552-1301(+)